MNCDDEEFKRKKHTEQEKKGKSPKSGDAAFNWLFSFFFSSYFFFFFFFFLFSFIIVLTKKREWWVSR